MWLGLCSSHRAKKSKSHLCHGTVDCVVPFKHIPLILTWVLFVQQENSALWMVLLSVKGKILFSCLSHRQYSRSSLSMKVSLFVSFFKKKTCLIRKTEQSISRKKNNIVEFMSCISGQQDRFSGLSQNFFIRLVFLDCR